MGNIKNKKVIMGRGKLKNPLGILAALAVGVLVISCNPKVQQPLSRLDTPEHHTFAGIVLLNQEKFTDAGREFEIALRQDPRHAKAHTGAGLVKAYRGDFAGGFEAIKQAENDARNNEEKIFTLVGAIRISILSHAACLEVGNECGPDVAWLTQSKDAFDKAVLIDPKAASAYFFMGECYLAALDLEAAGRMFKRVLDLNAEYVGEAERHWKFVRKILRAAPETVAGRKTALVERLTRADVAVLFIEEMKIGALFAQRTPKVFNSASRDPGKAGAAVGGRIKAKDVAGHRLRAYIEAIIRIGIRGLDVYPDGTFRPDEQVDRASYAIMIEDILIKVAGDPALATRFIGRPSPFPDLRRDHPYFNAAMVVTSRKIMEVMDPATGSFAPLGPLSGADALLVIRNMKNELRWSS
jgi:tetratricopeptide (TPR) repeat protein